MFSSHQIAYILARVIAAVLVTIIYRVARAPKAPTIRMPSGRMYRVRG